MKKIVLNESEKLKLISEREKAIIESFGKTYNSIKRIDENNKPSGASILYNLISGIAYSYVPADLKHFNRNTDLTLFNTILPHFTNEENYQESIKRKDFFFIYYNDNQYLYLPNHKRLYDKSANKVIAKEKSQVFRDQINQIIVNTLG